MHTPEVRISYGHLLDPFFKRLFELRPEKAGKPYPDRERTFAKMTECIAAWQPKERILLHAMCDVLGLSFSQARIDVYVVGNAGSSISDPMVISIARCNPEQFVDVLTHELLHRLLTQNTAQVNVGMIWSEMFPDHAPLARVHMLVHAVHQHIYLDVLREPERLEQDREKSAKNPDYSASWEEVDRRGYMNVIREFRSHYDHPKG